MRELQPVDTTAPTQHVQVLIAGVGNVFLRDDGFGSEVARRLADVPLPDEARVCDYGIGGVHLAYDLLEGYETLILIDTTSQGGEPGDVYVIDVDHEQLRADSAIDVHSMDPAAMFATLQTLGGTAPPTMMVGCEPADMSEGMGLTEPVEAAVDVAVDAVVGLVEGLLPPGDGAGAEVVDPRARDTDLEPSDRRDDREEG